MVLIGVLQTLYGLAAVFENEFFVVGPNYLYEIDISAWGWIHLVLGLVVLAAGLGAIAGQTWALCVAVIWALTDFGRREAELA